MEESVESNEVKRERTAPYHFESSMLLALVEIISVW